MGGSGGGTAQAGAQSVEGVTSCFVCGKHCYDAERLAAGGRLFHRKSGGHRGCFRCAQCDTPLNPANFSSAGRHVYCNAHFKQLFATTGDYRFAEGGGAEGGGAEGGGSKGSGEEGSKAGEAEVAASRVLAAAATASGQKTPAIGAAVAAAVASPAQLSSRASTSREERPLWPMIAGSTASSNGLANGHAPNGIAEEAEEEAGKAEEEEEEEEEEEPTCYLYGDLRIPFAIEEGWMRVRDAEDANNYIVVATSVSDGQSEMPGNPWPIRQPPLSPSPSFPLLPPLSPPPLVRLCPHRQRRRDRGSWRRRAGCMRLAAHGPDASVLWWIPRPRSRHSTRRAL